MNVPPEGARPYLHSAVIAENIEVVDILLIAGVNTEARYRGLSAAELAETMGAWDIAARLRKGRAGVAELMAAIEDDDVGSVATLLKDGVDPNAADAGGTTALIRALMVGNAEIVDHLVDAGADPNLQSEGGTLPLAVPVLTGDAELIVVLTDSGADPDAKMDGVPLLTVAVLASPKSVTALLDVGADKRVSDEKGMSPGDLAATLGEDELAAILGASRLEETREPQPSLADALASQNVDAIRVALERESPNQVTADGMPYLLAFAATASDARTLQVFASDPRTDLAITGRSGRDIIDAILANENPHIQHELLVALAGDLTSSFPEQRRRVREVLKLRDPQGRSGLNRLVIAMPKEHEDAFNLSKRVLDGMLDEKDGTGVTPLEAAVITGRSRLVERFLKQGAKVDGYSPSLQEIARAQENWRV